MSEHSLLSPSAAHRWSRCPASVYHCRDIKDQDTAYAAEGTRAHECAAIMLKDALEGLPSALNGQYLVDMLQHCTAYVAMAMALSAGRTLYGVEVAADTSQALGVPDQKGTVDFWAYIPEKEELQVHDLKYGKGVKVDAEENEQLIIYAAALFWKLRYDLKIANVRLVIHQPRLDHVSEVVYGTAALRSFIDDIAYSAGQVIDIMNAPQLAINHYHPGLKQCRFCAGRGTCAALAQHNLDQIAGELKDEAIEKATAGVPVLSDEKLATVYGALDLITLWVAAVKDAAMGRLLAGAKLPGLKLVAGRAGNRKWSNESRVEEMLRGMRVKSEEMYDRKLASPTTIEKVISARRWRKLAPMITRTDPAPAIAPATDKRPELVIPDVKNDFTDESVDDLL